MPQSQAGAGVKLLAGGHGTPPNLQRRLTMRPAAASNCWRAKAQGMQMEPRILPFELLSSSVRTSSSV